MNNVRFLECKECGEKVHSNQIGRHLKKEHSLSFWEYGKKKQSYLFLLL